MEYVEWFIYSIHNITVWEGVIGMNPELFVDKAVEDIMNGNKSMEEVLMKIDDPEVCHRIAVLIGAFW